MNKFKTLISKVVAASFAASVFASQAIASPLQDIIGTDIQNEVSVLSGLGVMVGDDTGTFRPNDPIKRSEVAKVSVAIMGLTKTADAQSTVSHYPDVDKDHWANGFINVATAQKLVQGDDTGTFRPDHQIKYSEAVTILVRALGYEPKALANGAFPTGYISTANSIGLTKGLSQSPDALIKRADVARLAYNALTIKLMEQTSFGSGASYEITDKTLLEDKLSASLVTGKVLAIGTASMGSQSALAKDEINIGGTVYSTGSADVRNFLGFVVDAYVRKETGSKRSAVLAIVPSEGMNRSVSIEADMISSLSNTSSEMSVHYYTDAENQNKTIKATLAKDAQIIYNGKVSTKDKFAVPSEGSITLLDTDGDAKYDTAFVNETVNYVVDQIFPSSNKITDKYNMGTLVLDVDNEDKTIVLEKAGKRIGISELKEWDVITVTKSEDENLIYATVIRNSFQGKVTEKDDTHVYIDGKKYKPALNFTSPLTLGTSGTFYLDQSGKIAAFDGVSAKSTNYAFLDKISLSQGFDTVINLRLFTKDGKLQNFSTGTKVKLNNQANMPAGQAFNTIGTEPKLITFETDASGKIIQINTFQESTTPNEDAFTLNLTEEGVVYRASSSKLVASETSISVGKDTVIFDLPEDGSADDYAIRGKDFLADGALYDISVFDMSEDYRAGAIIITSHEAKADESSPVAIVEKITNARDEDGETIHKLYALSEGKSITLLSKDDDTFKKEDGSLLAMGDIIQYRKNSSGKVDAIEILFEADEKETEFKTTISDNLTAIYGKVTKKFADSVNIQVADGKPQNYHTKNATVYVFDQTLSRPKVSIGDFGDVSVYENDESRVFLRIFKDEVKEIVVVK